MKPCDAFDICREIYASARELVDTRLPTVQLAAVSKYSWRPEMRPRLVEYVADFALAGEKALGGVHCGSNGHVREAHACNGRASVAHDARIANGPSGNGDLRAKGRAPLRASRLILFRMYYLGGAEYNAARRMLGIGEITWSAWTEEIRTLVGRELMRRGMFPPRRYFREMSSAETNRRAPHRQT